jgi:hypothetical protein
MAHARINKAAQLKASELPAHFDTFEAKSAKDFSKSTISMNYLSQLTDWVNRQGPFGFRLAENKEFRLPIYTPVIFRYEQSLPPGGTTYRHISFALAEMRVAVLRSSQMGIP